MSDFNTTLNENVTISDTFKARHVVIIHDLSLSISDVSEYIRGNYYTEVISIASGFLYTSSKVLNDTIKLVESYKTSISKLLKEVLTISDNIIKSFSRIFREVITIIAINPKDQYKQIENSLSLTDEFSKNWYRECEENLSIIQDFLLSSTRLTFSEIISIVQNFNARLDMKVLYETIKINTLLSFKRSALGCNEIISIADSFLRNMIRSIVETITIVATGIKNFPILLEESFSIFESQWSILNNMVAITCSERVVLGISTFQYQGLVMFKEIITVVDDLTVRVEKTFNELITVIAEYEDMFGLGLIETVNIIGNAFKTFSRIYEETIVIFSGIARSITMELEYIVLNDETIKVMSRIISEIITITDSIKKSMFRTFSEVITLVDEVYKRISRELSDALSLVDSKSILSFKLIREIINIKPWISNLLNGKIVTGLWARVERNFGTWRREDHDWK